MGVVRKLEGRGKRVGGGDLFRNEVISRYLLYVSQSADRCTTAEAQRRAESRFFAAIFESLHTEWGLGNNEILSQIKSIASTY